MVKLAESLNQTIHSGTISGLVYLLQPRAETNNLGDGALATALRTNEYIHLVQANIHAFDWSNIPNNQSAHMHIIFPFCKNNDLSAIRLHLLARFTFS